MRRFGSIKQVDDVPKTTVLGSMSEAEQLHIYARWSELEGQVTRLLNRVDNPERQAWAWQSHSDLEQVESTDSALVLPLDTPVDRRAALVIAGVPETSAH